MFCGELKIGGRFNQREMKTLKAFCCGFSRIKDQRKVGADYNQREEIKIHW
jgi:hypothetical protein